MSLWRPPNRIAPQPVLDARARALRQDAQGGAIRRVLAIRFGRLGDLLFTTPSLSLLAERFPDTRIDYLTRAAGSALVANHPAVTEVLHFEPGWRRPAQLLERRRLAREIAARSYDLALVFESDRETRTFLEKLCRRAGVRHVVSRSSHVAPEGIWRARHSCEKHMQLLSMLGLEPDDRPYTLHPSARDTQRADDFLREQGHDPDSADRPLLVGLQAGAHYSRRREWVVRHTGLRHKLHKLWPVPSWSRAGWLLGDRLGARLLLTGSAGERPLATRIAQAAGAPAERAPIVAAGETSVGMLAALVARTDLLLSIDTGTMHMAAALGVPTVALFGPTRPAHHGPYRRSETTVVLRSGIACSPCRKPVRKACPLNRCLTEITPEQLVAAGQALLARHPRSAAPA